MAEQLWSDERIDIEASEATETLDGTVFVRHVIRQSLKKVRDDLQAALDAANQRIAELEAAADPEALTIAYGKGRADGQGDCRKRIAELEAQGEWEPVIYSTFIEDASHDETYLLATLGGTQLEIGTDPTSDGVTVNLPKDYRLCHRKEGR